MGGKSKGMKAVLVLLVLALIAVAAVIVFKQMEYGQSEQYYDQLRGMARGWGIGT